MGVILFCHNEGDLFDGDAVKDESNVYVKDAEENEDTKSQLSGGTNEVSKLLSINIYTFYHQII